MDYLDKLIEMLQIQGKINVQCRLAGHWQLPHLQEPNLLGIFHIITQGECRLRLADQHFHLKAGDIFFLPQGIAHHLESLAVDPNANNAIQTHQQGHLLLKHNHTHQYDFEMFCGHFYYNGHLSPLFQLPTYWQLTEKHAVSSALLQLLRYESEQHLGSQSTIDALCRVLLTYLVRDYLQKEQHNGILAALQDQRLFPALNAMLLHPEQNWKMESLAAECAMSRANFIRLFKQRTNYQPGKFLTDLRMQKAQMLLRHSRKSVLAIALEVGYQSETYFSKTFKQHYGLSPSKFRESLANLS